MKAAKQELLRLVAQRNWGYHANGPNAAEPAALASLALTAVGRSDEATPLVEWLAELQDDDGSVGVTADQRRPAWPTSLAMLAWLAFDQSLGTSQFRSQRDRALQWSLLAKGRTFPKRPQMGHDTTIVAWSWADDTHAWIEPTSYFVLALFALGQADHPRTRDGVRMIVDRLHATGGCNYGNTVVLGQSTVAHVQPTGIAMLALGISGADDNRIEESLGYLEHEISASTSTSSLSFATMGLTAHGRRPKHAGAWLEQAYQRETKQEPSCYKLALLTLANIQDLSWLPRVNDATNSQAVINW